MKIALYFLIFSSPAWVSDIYVGYTAHQLHKEEVVILEEK